MTGLLYTETDIKVINPVGPNRAEYIIGTTPKNIPLNIEPEDYAGECVVDWMQEQGLQRIKIIHVDYAGAGHFNVLARASK